MVADLGLIIYIRDITISSSGKTVYATGSQRGGLLFFLAGIKRGLSAPEHYQTTVIIG